MISKRKLVKWRKEALLDKQLEEDHTELHQYADKVLELPQELIDQLYFLRKRNEKVL